MVFGTPVLAGWIFCKKLPISELAIFLLGGVSLALGASLTFTTTTPLTQTRKQQIYG
jgi:hypothetical protein